MDVFWEDAMNLLVLMSLTSLSDLMFEQFGFDIMAVLLKLKDLESMCSLIYQMVDGLSKRNCVELASSSE